VCAIYGYFEPGRRVDGGVALLSKMADVLRHRGPDGEGAYVAPSFGFGHLRLALVGGPEGKQPLAGCVGSDIKVVCAGEIFNHAELRRSLESEGHIFNASSDCETIAHLFEKEGIACLRRLNGQFAIAIWDQ
jgi:asparagine synthase (glutamine-hydrolysing)